MELITTLNRCHRFRGFVYQHARFGTTRRASKGRGRARVRPQFARAAICTAPGYDQLAERRFEFIPLWGFLVFLLYTMQCVDYRRCGVVVVEEVPWGDGKRTLTKTYMLFPSPLGAATVMERDGGGLSYLLGRRFDAVEHVVTWGLEHRTLGQIDAIGVDEIQY